LFDQMSSLVDEVRQIEGKVIEISRLQEVFAEKVLQQVGTWVRAWCHTLQQVYILDSCV